jgi:hypothetical protein
MPPQMTLDEYFGFFLLCCAMFLGLLQVTIWMLYGIGILNK